MSPRAAALVRSTPWESIRDDLMAVIAGDAEGVWAEWSVNTAHLPAVCDYLDALEARAIDLAIALFMREARERP